jgi:hypothetical protein
LESDKKANDYQVGGEHYQAKFQHWDLAAHNHLGYFEGQVTKYVTRWRKKNGLQDLDKAMHYLQKLIESIRDGVLPLPKYRWAQQLEIFSVQNGLAAAEKEVVCLMLCYTTVVELEDAMDRIKELKEKAQ